MPPKEPRPPSRFRLDLGGKEGIGNFRECTGLDSETTVIEHTSVDAPDAARVDGFIEMLDYNGTPIKRYKFLQGWPIKYTGVSFDPKSSDVAVEELQICHEGLEVE
jgi:hypothetical protein